MECVEYRTATEMLDAYRARQRRPYKPVNLKEASSIMARFKQPAAAVPVQERPLPESPHAHSILTLSTDTDAPRQRYSMPRIIHAVAKVHGMRAADVVGPRRAGNLVAARQHAMWLIHFYRPDLSYPAIGRAIGNRDHSTVMHGVKKWAGRAAFYKPLVDAVEEIL